MENPAGATCESVLRMVSTRHDLGKSSLCLSAVSVCCVWQRTSRPSIKADLRQSRRHAANKSWLSLNRILDFRRQPEKGND